MSSAIHVARTHLGRIPHGERQTVPSTSCTAFTGSAWMREGVQ